MPYEVKQLLVGLGDPVSAEPDEPIHVALDRMLHHGFSQLPVVKGSGQSRQFYLITNEAILLALHNFGSRINQSGLRVSDALVRVPNVYFATDDLFVLLAGMRDTNAALIVNEDRDITHVVTTYDTTQFFRQWAEDIMHARDIETSLKSIITSAFKRSDGSIDDEARRKAIGEITSSNKDLRKKFNNALRRYLSQQSTNLTLNGEWAGRAFMEFLNGEEDPPRTDDAAEGDVSFRGEEAQPESVPSSETLISAGTTLRKRFEAALTLYLQLHTAASSTPSQALADDAFSELYNAKEQAKPFSELTLGSYIQLFFHEHCWSRCSAVFGLEHGAVNHMLDGVRDTRNKLAHFREEEITTQQRLQLKRCSEWLGDLEKPVQAAFEASTEEAAAGLDAHQ